MTQANDIWPVLLPVIVGGVLALLPGVIAQAISHVLAQNASHKDRRRTQLAAFSKALYDFCDWVEAQRNHVVFDGPEPSGSNPLSNLMTIAALDFPELITITDQLERASLDLMQWFYGAKVKRLNGEPPAAATEGHLDMYQPFRKAVVEAEIAIRKTARNL